LFRLDYCNSLLTGQPTPLRRGRLEGRQRRQLIYFNVASVTFVTARRRPRYLQWVVFPSLPPDRTRRRRQPRCPPPSPTSPFFGARPTSTETNEIFDSTPSQRRRRRREGDAGWDGQDDGLGSIGGHLNQSGATHASANATVLSRRSQPPRSTANYGDAATRGTREESGRMA